MSAIAAPVTNQPAARGAGRIFKAGLTGGAIAAVLNLALYGAARLAGVDFTIQRTAEEAAQAIPAIAPGISSFVPSLLASLVALGLARLVKKPAPVFIGVAAVLLVVSMGPPLTLFAASTGARVVLSVMHVVAALPITWYLASALRR